MKSKIKLKKRFHDEKTLYNEYRIVYKRVSGKWEER
jgi:hypothetical protein